MVIDASVRLDDRHEVTGPGDWQEPGVDLEIHLMGLGGPSLDRSRQEDQELRSAAHRKLERADATIPSPHAQVGCL